MDNLLDKGRASDKALVVAGCVPQGDRRARQLQGLSVLGERRCLRQNAHPWRRSDRIWHVPVHFKLSCYDVLAHAAGVTQIDRVVEAVEETLKVRTCCATVLMLGCITTNAPNSQAHSSC